MTIKQSAWTGMVPVDDTALYVTDSGGSGLPVVYLNANLEVSAKVASNHTSILRKDSPAVAQSVRDLAAAIARNCTGVTSRTYPASLTRQQTPPSSSTFIFNYASPRTYSEPGCFKARSLTRARA